jgi:hypothetical protein
MRRGPVSPRSVPGKPKVGVEYLLVDTEGRILAASQSPDALARQLRRIAPDPQARERVRVVRRDDYGGAVMSASSFVTAMPLPSLWERPEA